MILLDLIRYTNPVEGAKGQVGQLFIDCLSLGYTLEPEINRLPNGLYEVQYCDSPKFGRKLPLIFNGQISAKRGFRIHSGKTLKNTRGCILLGSDYRLVGDEYQLLNSREAVNALCYILGVNIEDFGRLTRLIIREEKP